MLRGAIIGLGNVAVRGHVPAYLSGRTGARAAIAAVMDVAEENRAQARKLLPGAAVYASIDELLAHEKLDFADICTPPHTHSAIIGACASRGVHVLCEKPLAQNHADAEAAGKIVRDDPRLYAGYITNFGCGPDSFISHFFRDLSRGKPYLQLEIDEHSADAGAIIVQLGSEPAGTGRAGSRRARPAGGWPSR